MPAGQPPTIAAPPTAAGDGLAREIVTRKGGLHRMVCTEEELQPMVTEAVRTPRWWCPV
eukprot:CAMPEP_0119533446 /NCGR_PEP_ID=MMETSP1344-20130328/46840_1 /TAXON_ID=236787 /ORGANISM="Florenciella parvula, Strain CCMP2471" /LENGTH=58 /DNA_ID=CAMNT_0007574333 /DNA_START=95 /DNA_END=267 /DNA_ORIENTATION=-